MKKKKAPIFPLLVFILFPLFLLGGGLVMCYRVTGFSTAKIHSELHFNENWETEPLTQSGYRQLVEKILPQTYYYLASGTHCYVFISEDKHYVLKFFKTRHIFPKEWLSPFSFLRYLAGRREEGTQFFSERIFASYKDAYDSLRNESGLIYTHLNKKREFRTKVCLIDNKGKKHRVDVDEVEFVVQKKAVKIFDHLHALVKQHDQEGLKAAIRSFLQLIAIRCEKGFTNQDIALKNHFGFIGNHAIQMNCNSLIRDNSMKYPMNFREEILQAAKRLDLWASENQPELSFFIQYEAQRIIQDAF
jgi:hypothetical protein